MSIRGFQLTPNIAQSLGQGIQIKGELERQQLEQQAAQATLDKQARVAGIIGRLGGGPRPVATQPQTQTALPQLGAAAPGVPPAQLQPAAPQLGTQLPPAQLGDPRANTAQQFGQQLNSAFGNSQAMAELAVVAPDIFDQVNKNLGLISQQQKDEAASFAFTLRSAPFAQRDAMIAQREATVTARGGNPADTLSLRGLSEADQNKALEVTQIAALSNKDRLEISLGKPLTEFQAQSLELQRKRLGFQQRQAGIAAAKGVKPQADTAGIQDFKFFQDLKKTDPVAAQAFGIERGFINKEGQELSGFLQKRLAEATDTAVKSTANVRRFNNVATRIESNPDFGGGLFGSAQESLKDLMGGQDEVTTLKKEARSIIGAQVVENLPPGSASDVDVALALDGFPSKNASQSQLTSYFKGLAKLQQLDADLNQFKTDFISVKGTERGMLKAWNEIQGKNSGQQAATAPEQPQLTTQQQTLNQLNAPAPVTAAPPATPFATTRRVQGIDSPVQTQGQATQQALPVVNGRQVTEADVQATMNANGMTRQQVLNRLGGIQ